MRLRIVTQRLELVPATVELVHAALAGRQELGNRLHAAVPPTWPPDFLDSAALEYTIARLAEGSDQEGWWMYFVIFRDDQAPVLIGSGGYKGPPAPDGTVEVGYGIVRDYQRRGFATEVAAGLIARAFDVPGVQRVIGETLPSLLGSIGVLKKCGFSLIGAGSEPGVIRFELTREDYLKGMAARLAARLEA